MFGSMKEINDLPKTKGKVFSTFSGCGGSSLGYKMAGYDVLGCLEFMIDAVDTYKANHPTAKVIHDDIRKVSGQQILDLIGLKKGELDILDGSPPCSAFSQSGIREDGWGKEKAYSKTKQRVDDLFFEYLRLVDEIRPKVAMAENVVGLTVGTAKDVLHEILQLFRKIGYDAYYQVLNGADFGAPQTRKRVILVFIREDLNISNFYYPKPTHEGRWISVREAISDIENSDEELKMLLDAGEKHANYRFWSEIGVGDSHPRRFNLVRNEWDKPSKTVLQSNANLGAAGLCHPFEKRRHTIAECKRLMGFPDDFILTGEWADKMERLGRSVNPQVIKAVAEEVYYQVLNPSAKREIVEHDNGYYGL